MNKQTKNATIIRLDYSKIGYLQIAKTILTNKNLSDSGLRLLQLMLDTPPTKKISLTYYSNILGWSSTKRDAASKNLKDNGFLKIVKSKRENTYYFTISEYGNLIQEEVEKVVVLNVIPEVIPEPIQPEIVLETIPEVIYLKDYLLLIGGLITEAKALDCNIDFDIEGIFKYLEGSFNAGKITSKQQLSEKNLKILIKRYIIKLEPVIEPVAVKQIKLTVSKIESMCNNGKFTAAQLKTVTKNMIAYVNNNPTTTEWEFNNKLGQYKLGYQKVSNSID
tara:strand:+ start:872 stop:1705 length:834 start_codon:yes stop_codon:yes gene_type:complete